MPASIETSFGDTASELWSKRTEGLLSSNEWNSKAWGQARRLEDKVAKVAQKKTSVEEVSYLHKELETYLGTVKPGEQQVRPGLLPWNQSDSVAYPLPAPALLLQVASLFLSAALLRAILSNHVAHAEASKHAKATESDLRSQLDNADIIRGKLEAELRKCVNVTFFHSYYPVTN
jgi:hypothetical protein